MGPRPSPLPGWEDEQSVSRTVLYKKVTKPLLERQRRARINRCLDELKELMSATLAAEGENLTKLEKADVLELTVRHLHQLHREGELSLSGPSSPLGRHPPNSRNHATSSVLESRRYQGGFLACAQQVASYVTKFPGVEPGVSQRLMAHLGNCAQHLCEAAAHSTTAGLPFLPPPPLPLNPRTATATPLMSSGTSFPFPHLPPVNLSIPALPPTPHSLPYNSSLGLGPHSHKATSIPSSHPPPISETESAFKIPVLPAPTATMASTSPLTSPKDKPVNLSQTTTSIGIKRPGSADAINAPKKRFLNAAAQQNLLAAAQSQNSEELGKPFLMSVPLDPVSFPKSHTVSSQSEEPVPTNVLLMACKKTSNSKVLSLNLDNHTGSNSTNPRFTQALNLTSSAATVTQPTESVMASQASPLPLAIGSTLTITPYLHAFPPSSSSSGAGTVTGHPPLPFDMTDGDQDMWRPW